MQDARHSERSKYDSARHESFSTLVGKVGSIPVTGTNIFSLFQFRVMLNITSFLYLYSLQAYPCFFLRHPSSEFPCLGKTKEKDNNIMQATVTWHELQ